jgi:hypothetical protein
MGCAYDELRKRSLLPQQDRGLERRLSAADDCHTASAQLLEGCVLGGVRDELRRKPA